MKKREFDIIITSFNALKYLKRCLSSIQKWTEDFDYKITVVDNGSRDGTKDYLKNKKEILFISLEKNLGPAKAFNEGVKATKGEFIVRLDDDVEVTKQWLKGLYSSIKRDEKIGIVGLKAVFKNGDISFAEDMAKYYCIYTHERDNPEHRSYVRYCDVVLGACMLLRRSLVEEIGYFDENLKCYVDMDFCFRARIAGYKIVYNGRAKVIHHQLFRYRNALDYQKELFHSKWENFKQFPLKDSHPADRYNTLGLDYLISDDYRKAFYFLKKTENLDRRLGLPFFIAVALWGMGRKKEALAKLKTLLKKPPMDHRVKCFLGLIYLKKKNYEKAFRLIKSSPPTDGIKEYHQKLSDAVYRVANM